MTRAEGRPAGETYRPGMSQDPLRVVIAGAGVAGLETALGLRALAGERVETMLIDTATTFSVRAMSVAEPFLESTRLTLPVDQVAAEAGAAHIRDMLASVDPRARIATTTDGTAYEYDALVLAVGAQETSPFPGVVTFRPEDLDPVREIVDGVHAGAIGRVAVVVPDERVWPMPGYELALLLAREGAGVTLVAAEPAPLRVFGPEASKAVGRLLDEAGVETLLGGWPAANRFRVSSGERTVEADTVIALPALRPREIAGIPGDRTGWLPVDAHGRVAGLDDVFAAGDITARTLKQGGLAAQQADAVVEAIVARLHPDLRPWPYTPVLRGWLLTGDRDLWIRTGPDAALVADHCLWWPQTKIAGRWLSPWLEAREGGRLPSPPRPGMGLEVRFDPPAVPREPEILSSPFVR